MSELPTVTDWYWEPLPPKHEVALVQLNGRSSTGAFFTEFLIDVKTAKRFHKLLSAIISSPKKRERAVITAIVREARKHGVDPEELGMAVAHTAVTEKRKARAGTDGTAE